MKFGKIVSLFAASTAIITSPVLMSPQPPLYQIIRGQYEDKIRRYSPPEKIYNVFAQKNHNDELVLNLENLLKTICFYNYSQSTQSKEHLIGFEAKSIKKFLGKDDQYQIYDYFNFARFIVYPDDKIIQFMESKKTECTKEIFLQFMLNHVCKDYDEFMRPSVGIESRNYNPKKSDYILALNRTADSLFKDKNEYSIKQIIQFRLNIIKQIYTFEFKSFDLKGKEIDGVQFARSIIKYTSHNSKRRLLRRVSTIHDFIEPIKINEQEYVQFHVNLHINDKILSEHLRQKGVISRKQMRLLFCDKQAKITDKQLQIFFQLLDIDNSGFIDKKEILGVIQDLGYYWNVKSGDLSLKEMLDIKWRNLKNKIIKIQQIIMEQ